MGSRLNTLLVVEDSDTLRASLVEALSARAARVLEAFSVASACEHLTRHTPEVVVLDFALPDGTAFDVLKHALTLVPMPRFVAISGCVGTDDAFRLADFGVRAFLAKPVNEAALGRALDRALEEAPALGPRLRASVGLRGVVEIEDEVRKTMVTEAMARSEGSKRAAARLLSISRQLLQHILRRDA